MILFLFHRSPFSLLPTVVRIPLVICVSLTRRGSPSSTPSSSPCIIALSTACAVSVVYHHFPSHRTGSFPSTLVRFIDSIFTAELLRGLPKFLGQTLTHLAHETWGNRTVVGFNNASSNACQGVAITPKGNGVAYRAFVGVRV